MQRFFNIHKSINVKYHINKLNNENLIISTEKVFWQNSTSIYDKKKKNSLESEHRGNIPIIIKVTYDKPMANISAVKRWKEFPPKIRNNTKRPTLKVLFNIVLEVLARVLRQGKQIKGNKIGKENLLKTIIVGRWYDTIHRKS